MGTKTNRKKIKIITLICIGLVTLFLANETYADIQAPPGSKYNRTRKLSRGLANVLYSSTEIPKRFETVAKDNQGNAMLMHGLVDGIKRTGMRIGYGVYEIVTFPVRSYKRGYKEPYKKKIYYDVEKGYTEYPPQLGASSHSNYVRNIRY